MKKFSVKLFLAVMLRGLCQAFGWFFGLFGYKRDGKFAKCVWGLFAISVAVIMVIRAVMMVTEAVEYYYEEYYKEAHCYDPSCCYANYISEHVYYHEACSGEGYVYNTLKGKKTVKDVQCITESGEKDTLVCFSNGKKQGYFNKFTGEQVIEPKYDHACVFSEGLACVDIGGYMKFIDTTGKVIIDSEMKYVPGLSDYVFHWGYCVIKAKDGEHYGLMDRKGQIVLSTVFKEIERDAEYNLWRVQKGREMAVLDRDLKYVLPLMECSLMIYEGTINVTMPDHTLRMYTLQGDLMNDFCITDVRMLEYEKEEMRYEPAEYGDNDNNRVEMPSYHPQATARLRAYTAGDGYEGLMTADGKKVTMPLYKDIEAIGYDMYLCALTDYDKVIVNGKGEVVK